MSEFKKIETQEELDKIISDRLLRQKDKLLKDYSDYENVKNENVSLKKSLEELKSSNKDFEDFKEKFSKLENENKSLKLKSLKLKIASEYGIPLNLAERLNGADENSLKEDALSLSDFFKPDFVAPLKEQEKKGDNDPYKNLLENLKEE